MKSYSVLFAVGLVLLLVSFVAAQYIYLTMSDALRSQLEEQIGRLGDLMWAPLILGIILTGIGYWMKPSKE